MDDPPQTGDGHLPFPEVGASMRAGQGPVAASTSPAATVRAAMAAVGSRSIHALVPWLDPFRRRRARSLDAASALVAVVAVLLGTDGWVGSLEAVDSGTHGAVRYRREAELR